MSYNQGALSLFLYQCVCWTQLRFSVNFLQGNRNGFEGAGEGKDSWVVKSTLLGVAGCKMQMRHLNIERGKKKMIKDFSDVMMWGSGLRRLGGRTRMCLYYVLQVVGLSQKLNSPRCVIFTLPFKPPHHLRQKWRLFYLARVRLIFDSDKYFSVIVIRSIPQK